MEKFALEKEIFLVTKLATGGDLMRYILKRKKNHSTEQDQSWFTEEQVRHLFIQIALGLKDLHSLHLVHRDVKPLNIFLCDGSDMPRVKIGDLGFAIRLQPGRKIVKKAGTEGFMAPEVARREPYDSKCDIYSLGVLLYFLIA